MIIAARLLKLREKGIDRDVPIRIFAPVSDDASWICRYEIGWPEGRRESAAYGVDAMQALVLALQKIGFDLYTSKAHKTGALMWESAGQGYDFPSPSMHAIFLSVKTRDLKPESSPHST